MVDHSAPQFTSPGERASAYWFTDGLPELTFGLGLAAVGGIGLLARVYLSNHWVQALFLLFAIAFLALLIMNRKIVEWLKSYITYPRTGYVRSPTQANTSSGLITLELASSPRPKNIVAFPSGVFSVLVLCSSVNDLMRDSRVTPFLIMALALALYAVSKISDLPYSFVSVIPVFIVGVILVPLNVNLRVAYFFPFLFTGLWLFFRGLFTLIHYLRVNPRQPRTQEIHA